MANRDSFSTDSKSTISYISQSPVRPIAHKSASTYLEAPEHGDDASSVIYCLTAQERKRAATPITFSPAINLETEIRREDGASSISLQSEVCKPLNFDYVAEFCHPHPHQESIFGTRSALKQPIRSVVSYIDSRLYEPNHRSHPVDYSNRTHSQPSCRSQKTGWSARNGTGLCVDVFIWGPPSPCLSSIDT